MSHLYCCSNAPHITSVSCTQTTISNNRIWCTITAGRKMQQNSIKRYDFRCTAENDRQSSLYLSVRWIAAAALLLQIRSHWMCESNAHRLMYAGVVHATFASMIWFSTFVCGPACAVQWQTFLIYANHFVYTGLIRRWIAVVRFLVAILLWRRLCGRFAASNEFSTRIEYCAAVASASKVKFSFQMRLILTAKFGPHTWPFDAIANRTMSFDKYTELVCACMCSRLAIVTFMRCGGGGGGCLVRFYARRWRHHWMVPLIRNTTIQSFGWRRRVTPNPFRR